MKRLLTEYDAHISRHEQKKQVKPIYLIEAEVQSVCGACWMQERVRSIQARVSSSLPVTSDEDVIALLTNEAERRKRMVRRLGVLAYITREEPTLKKGAVNKHFLRNTIQSVASHNRREEEAECWRERKLQEALCNKEKERLSRERKRRRSDSKAREKEKAQEKLRLEQQEERRRWACQKLLSVKRKRREETPDGEETEEDSSERAADSEDPQTSLEDHKRKKHKTEKHKKHKKHKKKHKKGEHKKREKSKHSDKQET